MKYLAVLAQSVERTAFNRVVVGSNPTDGAFLFITFLLFFYSLCTLRHKSMPGYSKKKRGSKFHNTMIICTEETQTTTF
jgi:hypothetical protein